MERIDIFDLAKYMIKISELDKVYENEKDKYDYGMKLSIFVDNNGYFFVKIIRSQYNGTGN